MIGLYLLTLIALIICPISVIFIISAVIANHTIFHRRYWGYLIIASSSAIIFYIGVRINSPVIPLVKTREIIATAFPFLGWEFKKIDTISYILSDFRTLGVALVLESVSLYLATLTPERMMINGERQREKSKMTLQRIDYIPKRSQVIFGVSGSGKSAYIGKSIEEILSKNPSSFVVIVDGKGSTEKYSLFYSCMIIAKKLDKRLVVINGTSNNELSDYVYDFLEGIESTDAMKDMVMSLLDNPSVQASAGSEHYKVITERYILKIIEFMQSHDIDVTLFNLLKLLDPADLNAVLDQMDFDSSEKKELKRFVDDSWSDVRANVEKLKMFMDGQGKKIFTGEGERINLRTAYSQRDIVLVLADEMSMPELASKLVQLVAYDLRNLIAGRLTGSIDMNDKIYSYWDEFSGYTSATKTLQSIYARARSADCICSLATQSCSDIIGLGDGWFERIIDTADRYVIFRQNSAEAAESAASIFGTELHVTDTARTSELQSTGEASNTVDRSFIVSPDMIRNLMVNRGFLLDKTKRPNHQLKYFKNKFVKEN
ncbi:TraM recognition domain-containing protein [Butyrivibrio sp. AC2005]|uniref:TraM recognition domain-containing protein n=1 Tax=Butyrivibrio sp. AC2005 TaxID=1280672 RepID=UPI000419CF21|nr:TraM recognition domain-containing protein [Butyrivibrio sp. AC2005]